MLGMVMTRLFSELVYESGNWALRLEGERSRLPISDVLTLLPYLAEVDAQQLSIDLSKITRVDSTGLKFLLSLYQECAHENIQLILRNPSQHLERIIKIMQLTRLFIIEHDEDQAGEERGN
jgi:anti-sigma B factor antagonist